MINLLPPELKSHYRFAARNTQLRKWIVSCFLAMVGAIVIGAAGLLYLKQISHSYDQQVAAATQTLKDQKIDETRKDVNDISSNLKLSVQVLSQEVLFSKLLSRLATLTPANTSLSALNISQSADAIDITANTADYNTATQLQVNLADPDNQIFSKADIVGINCSTGDAATPVSKYPCIVNIRALLATDNPFLFINDTKAGS
jgi:Tfp pilus assembly protein PilN